jgi:hypothetical protein
MSVNAETLRRWEKGVALFYEYCSLNDALVGSIPAYPTDDVLAGFSTWLVDFKSKAPKAVRQLLLGVARWALNLEPGRGDPRLASNGRMTFLLYSTLRGLTREHARKKPVREALTTDKLTVMLQKLEGMASSSMAPSDRTMFAALLTLGVFGLCRCGELTTPTTTATTLKSPTLGDVRVYRDATGTPTHYEFTISGSKTDVFRRGATVVIYATGTRFCPVTLMVRYLHSSSQRPLTSPLFVRNNGRFVTRDHVNRFIKQLASLTGFEPQRFSTHSMRAGGATSLSLLGYSPAVIQQLGRWVSDAYLAYIRLPEDQHREAMLRMASLPPSSAGTRAAAARANNDVWGRLRRDL